MHHTTRFVAACCRWPIDAAAQEAVRRAAERVEDWAEVREAVMRHRVAALVHEAVQRQSGVPDTFRDWVKAVSQEQARHTLHMTQECIALDAALVTAGIEPVHLKGPVLGQLAFGSVARKYSRDLDILVAEADALAAICVFQEKGYRRSESGATLTTDQARGVIRHCKDLSLVGPEGHLVELHWRLAHTKALMNGLESRLGRQTVKVAQTADMPTMGDEQLVFYLCVHGASHHWMRLKWLAELAAFLNQLAPARRAAILEALAATPERAAIASALKLCDTFLDTNYAPSMSRRATALYRYALWRIDHPLALVKRLWGDWRLVVDLVQMRHLYASSWGGLWALRAHLIGQDDVVAWPLPASLNAVYVLVRLPSLLVRRLGAVTSRRTESPKPLA